MKKILLALSVVVPFCFYFLGLAPSVTLEDSGELVTAASQWGVPHPPGYPLFSLLGNLWVRILPFEAAYSMNLFSAVTSAFSGLFIFLTVLLLLRTLPNRKNDTSLDEFFALLGVLLVTLSPHYFRQSVITEVYGLHNLLWSAFVFFSLKSLLSERSPGRYFFISCFLLGLGLSNHHLMIVGGLLVAFVLWNKRRETSVKVLLGGVGIAAFGLLPYLYLPLTEYLSPGIYWGHPNKIANILEVVTRAQYNPHLNREMTLGVEQLREQVLLLLGQYPVSLLFFGTVACGLLLVTNIRLGLFFILAALLTGPISALLINFDLPLLSPDAHIEVASLMSVFFLSHYQIWGVLIAVGAFMLSRNWKSTAAAAFVCLTLVASLGFGVISFLQESKRNDTFALKFYQNLSRVSDGKPALVLVNWDPFSFPAIYFQRVLGLFPNLRIVDVEMLKGPWYLEDLQKQMPELLNPIHSEVTDYLKMEKEARSVAGVPLWPAYQKMLSALVKNALDEHLVFLVASRDRIKFPGVFDFPFEVESVAVAGRIKKPGSENLNVPIESLDLSGFDSPTVSYDRLHQMLAKYYAQLLIERAQLEEKKNRNLLSQVFLNQARRLER